MHIEKNIYVNISDQLIVKTYRKQDGDGNTDLSD